MLFYIPEINALEIIMASLDAEFAMYTTKWIEPGCAETTRL